MQSALHKLGITFFLYKELYCFVNIAEKCKYSEGNAENQNA
jgi:hypothetical protein